MNLQPSQYRMLLRLHLKAPFCLGDAQRASTWLLFPILIILLLILSTVRADIYIESNDHSFIVDSETGIPVPANDYAQSIRLQLVTFDQQEGFVSLAYKLTNTSNSTYDVIPLRVSLGRGMQIQPDPKAGFGAEFYDYLEPFLVDQNSVDVVHVNKDWMLEHSTIDSGSWFGWVNRYDFEAIRFDDPTWSLELKSSDTDILTPEELWLVATPVSTTLAEGESLIIRFDYVNSPKSKALLEATGLRLEGIVLMNLWDWFRPICFVVWDVTEFLFEFSGNWGVSLILLALLIRVVTFPITRFSLKFQEISMQQQARIKPFLNDIKNNFSGIEQSEKIIELYEDQHYDQLAPFKSMFGLFIQILILAALFNVLGEVEQLSGQSFLWVTDLAKSDRLYDWGIDIPYFGSYFNLLPVVMGSVTILSTWLSAKQAGNEKSPTITLFGMGILFFILFYSFPAALVLYWLSSIVFQILQQIIENKLKR
jgi:YidC/Oxa1 family membrane protein insertase